MVVFISAASAGGNKFPDHAPFQESVKKRIANGKLAVSESPAYKIDILEKDDKHMKLKATTKIEFKNSKEAGLDKWKKFEIKDLTGVKGVTTNKPGDYDQKIKEYILQQIQSTQDPTERAKNLKHGITMISRLVKGL